MAAGPSSDVLDEFLQCKCLLHGPPTTNTAEVEEEEEKGTRGRPQHRQEQTHPSQFIVNRFWMIQYMA